MVLFFDDGFNQDLIYQKLLEEKAEQRKCGYFELRVVSDKLNINFLQLFCNYISDNEIKEYLCNLKFELLAYKRNLTK